MNDLVRKFITGAFLAISCGFPPQQVLADVASDAQAVFVASCYGCHGQPPYRPVAGLNLLNVNEMVQNGLIVQGSPGFSLPYQYMEAGIMPPPGQAFPNGLQPKPVDAAALAKVKTWILAGAPPFFDESVVVRRQPKYLEIVTTVKNDLQAAAAEDRGRYRYFSLGHMLGTTVSNDNIKLMQVAVSKFINSLSLNPVIKNPRLISAPQLLFRIDLRDYGWVDTTWRLLLSKYPFSAHNIRSSAESTLERTIADLSGSTVPFVRGDWFVGAGSRPNIYHKILYEDLKGFVGRRNALVQLEQSLGIDRIGNILNGRISRSGFSNSGVSVNNRIIERHEISDYQGYYWLSYDFAGTSADSNLRQNIFANPMGPKEAFTDASSSFLHAGGEVIFSLPNGLQGYLLIDNQGQRLDKAPTNIVTDPARPDRAVENAVSCFRCHDHGINLKRDVIRDYLEQNHDLFRSDYNVLLSLYDGRERNFALQTQDLNHYLNAVVQVGIDLRAAEPITMTVNDFEQDVTLRRLAAELYLNPADLLQKIDTDSDLRRLIGVLSVPEGRITREFVLENFSTISNLVFSP